MENTTVFAKYLDFNNYFMSNFVMKLSKITKINNYLINQLDYEQTLP